jgi:hypothetical protein
MNLEYDAVCVGSPSPRYVGRRTDGRLSFTEEGVSFRMGHVDKTVTWPWESTRVTLLDSGRKKSSKRAMLAFGVAGALATRKRFTLMVLSSDEGDVDFDVMEDPARLPVMAQRVAEVAGDPSRVSAP